MKMNFDFNKSQTFQRYSDPITKKNLMTHLYMPWCSEIDSNLLFKIKYEIRKEGSCFLPYMDLNGAPIELDKQSFQDLRNQVEMPFSETYLVMYNQQVIHVLKVKSILNKFHSSSSSFFDWLPQQKSNYSYWLELSDVYVYDVDYLGVKEDLSKKLLSFMFEDSSQKFFNHSSSLCDKESDLKWVVGDRQFTYDYFMRSCELEETIYPNCWNFFSKRTQHKLVVSELLRKESISFRNVQKWDNLKESFLSYKGALTLELNEIYIFPMVDAIKKYDSFFNVWTKYTEGTNGKNLSIQIIDQLVKGSFHCLDDLNNFLYFMENIKALTYSLKNQFSKNCHHEQSLIIEKFLNKQELKIESFRYKSLSKKISMIDRIEAWVIELDNKILDLNARELKRSNLKLTHLLSMMSSSSGRNNIFFDLIEEKIEKSCVSLDLAEEIASLFTPNSDLKLAV